MFLDKKKSLEIFRSIDSGQLEELEYLVSILTPQDINALFVSLPQKHRRIIWTLMSEDDRHLSLNYLYEDIRTDLLKQMDLKQLLSVSDEMELDDFADILQQLPSKIADRVLAAMNEKDRSRLEVVLSFPEDSAGGLMNTDTITIQPRHSIELVLRYLRLHDRLPSDMDHLIVVNKRDEYLGVLPIVDLLVSDPNLTIRELMDTDFKPIVVDTSAKDVSVRFREEDLISAPVVDVSGKLLGRIAIDDVVDVIIDDADSNLLHSVGLNQDEDTFASPLKSLPSRTTWLGINLITAFMAASVIAFFQEVVKNQIALAILMPVIASMGGIAATQTLTIVIRAIALNHIHAGNIFWLLNKELLVALMNGLLWAFLLGGGIILYFQDLTLAYIMAVSTIITLITAAIAGIFIPRILYFFKIDMAIAGGVLVTTITDLVGFFSFLGLASLYYGG